MLKDTSKFVEADEEEESTEEFNPFDYEFEDGESEDIGESSFDTESETVDNRPRRNVDGASTRFANSYGRHVELDVHGCDACYSVGDRVHGKKYGAGTVVGKDIQTERLTVKYDNFEKEVVYHLLLAEKTGSVIKM